MSFYAYLLGVLMLVALFFAPSSIAPVIKGTKAGFVIDKIGCSYKHTQMCIIHR